VIIVVTILVVFVGGEIIHQIVNSATPSDHLSATSWVADIAPVVAQENTLNATFSFVEKHGATMSRPQLTLNIDSLVTSADSAVAEARSDHLSPPSEHTPTLLLASLAQRAHAFSDLQNGVNEAINGGSSLTAAAQFSKAANAMKAAQVGYLSFVRSLVTGSDRAQLPKVAWTKPDTIFSASTLGGFARQLVGATQLRPRDELAVTAISMNPLPEIVPTTTTSTTTTTTIPKNLQVSTTTTTTTSSGKRRRVVTSTTTITTTTLAPIAQIPTGSSPSVFAPTGSIRPIVVVKNEGNVAEHNVEIVALMDGERRVSAPIASLAPGRSTYLEMRALVVHTSTMASCAASSLRHDRCTSLEVAVEIGTRVMAHRSIDLAFYVV
jgi:hypothetical protein